MARKSYDQRIKERWKIQQAEKEARWMAQFEQVMYKPHVPLMIIPAIKVGELKGDKAL